MSCCSPQRSSQQTHCFSKVCLCKLYYTFIIHHISCSCSHDGTRSHDGTHENSSTPEPALMALTHLIEPPRPPSPPPDGRIVYEDMEDICDYIRQQTDIIPEIGVICGSGLGGLADHLDSHRQQTIIHYKDIPKFPTCHGTLAKYMHICTCIRSGISAPCGTVQVVTQLHLAHSGMSICCLLLN